MGVKYKAQWFPHGERKASDILHGIIAPMKKAVSKEKDPSVSLIARETRSAFRVLVSTVISARTKDEVTAAASARLFAIAGTAEEIAALDTDTIEKAIYPAGFYKTKARAIRGLSLMILSDFEGKVPDSIDELVLLPGVGRKTANLTVTLGFGKLGICVDTHVHRVCNRLGAIRTKSPEETEYALRRVLVKKHWIEINDLLVMYGKSVCTPVSPRCSACVVNDICERAGVMKSR